MSLNRTFAIVLRQFYLVRGSPARILPMFAWVAIDMILWGFMTKYLNTVTAAGFDFVPVLLGAVLLWDFFTRVMQGVTMAFFEDVWSRNFLNIFASPLTITEYLAAAAFGLSFLSYGGALVGLVLVLFLFGIALGVAACAGVLQHAGAGGHA